MYQQYKLLDKIMLLPLLLKTTATFLFLNCLSDGNKKYVSNVYKTSAFYITLKISNVGLCFSKCSTASIHNYAQCITWYFPIVSAPI